MKKSYVTLLTYNQVVGTNRIDVIGKSKKRVVPTDLVTLLCGHNMYYTKTIKDKDQVFVVNEKTISFLGNRYTYSGIRPVVPFSKIEKKINNKKANEDSILEVEYGTYPQNIVDDELYKELRTKYDNNELCWCGTYKLFIDGDYYLNCYRYNNSVYAAFLLENLENFDNDSFSILSNGLRPEEWKLYFLKIEPIKWLVDTKTGLAISKNILNYGSYDIFMNSLKEFQNDIEKFGYDKVLTTKNGSNNNENKKTDDVSNIIDEISHYLNYYHGSIDIDKRVNEIINEYNNKINKSFYKNNTILTLDNLNKDELYLNLLTDLNDILNGLKLNYENNKVYHDILELLNKIINNDSPESELETLVYSIKNVILPYLNDDVINKIFNDILLNIKKYVEDEIEKIENLDTKINGKYKSMLDFELDLRTDLQLFLLSIYKDIIDKDIIDNIIKNANDISNNNYDESKKSIINVYLNTINQLIKDIKNRGNKFEIEKAQKILNNIEISDLNTSISSLANIIKELYKIIFDIDERDNELKNINKYIIDTRKIRIKTQ